MLWKKTVITEEKNILLKERRIVQTAVRPHWPVQRRNREEMSK
jgi:hypothetical protein